MAQGASLQGRVFEPPRCHQQLLASADAFVQTQPRGCVRMFAATLVHGVVAPRPLSMREALGSIPSVSTLWRLWFWLCLRTKQMRARFSARGYGATPARLTPDQKVGN